MKRFWIGLLAVALAGCRSGGGSATDVHVRIKNQGKKPATLYVLMPLKSDPGTIEWQTVGIVKPQNEGEFDLPLSKLGPDKNIRLQPGAGPIQMAALNSKTVKSSEVVLTMKEDETMDVTY